MISYSFTEKTQGVHLSLEIEWGYLYQFLKDKLNRDPTREEIRNCVIKETARKSEELSRLTQIPDDFESSNYNAGANSIFTIFTKYYDKKDILSEEQLKSDLKEMLRLYGLLYPSIDKFEVLSDSNDIREAQILFENRFKEVAVETFEAPSQNKKQPLLWSSKIGIWGFFGEWKNRFINRFGIGKPEVNSDNPTTCEINIPYEGVEKSISGSFAKDSEDNLYLLHNGSIYGHIVTKEDYSGSWVEIEDDDQTNDLILIGGLSDQDFPEKLRDFLIQIDRIKNNKVDNSIGSFFEFLSGNGYLFDPNLVENFLLSLKVKPFVILTGNSGTGKTKVAQLFAHYLAKKSEEYDNKKHEIVPVGANWTENRHVLGFYNVITENYQKTQALDLILNASIENQNIPYFLILDEMNLSHVERYFSDFLSGMESHEPIPLHDNDAEHIPQELELPNNLLVIGTVNVDETTYMFSPKVLDRANTIEFLTHSPLNYMSNEFTTQTPSGDLEYLQNPLSDIYNPNVRKMTIDDVRESFKSVKTSDDLLLWDNISEEIDNIYIKLKKAGFDFGFRVVNEIMRFMYVSWKYEGSPIIWENWERYFDAQIKQKILPKLHGSQRTLETTIKSLFEICYGESVEKDPRLISDQIISMAKFPTSALKLRDMDNILYNQRYVAFIN
jgi:energy-coupling factor transporter ATP-binding protein EcfA2